MHKVNFVSPQRKSGTSLACAAGSLVWVAMLVSNSSAHAQDMPLSQIIAEDHSWTLVKGGYSKIDGLFTDASGRVRVIHGKGMDFVGTDGAVRIRHDADSDVKLPHQARTRRGLVYIIREDELPLVSLISRNAPVVETPGVNRPAGLALSPDDSTLFVGDAAGKAVWAFRVEKDGTLTAGEPYCPLRLKPEQKESGVACVITDAVGRIYAGTPLGVQIFDPTGRLCGVLNNPCEGKVTALAFGGSDRNVLYMACGDKLYSRQMLARGSSAE
jgi:sugar lactone lactonase YvrE